MSSEQTPNLAVAPAVLGAIPAEWVSAAGVGSQVTYRRRTARRNTNEQHTPSRDREWIAVADE